MKKIKIKGKIGAYIAIMLLGAVVISSSISAFELNKNFGEEKNSVTPVEKQSMANLNSFSYSSNGAGFIWLSGHNGYLNLMTGNYNITFTGPWDGLAFIPGAGSGPAITCMRSPTYAFTAGHFGPPLSIFFTFRWGSTTGGHVWVIGPVLNTFTITGTSYT